MEAVGGNGISAPHDYGEPQTSEPPALFQFRYTYYLKMSLHF